MCATVKLSVSPIPSDTRPGQDVFDGWPTALFSPSKKRLEHVEHVRSNRLRCAAHQQTVRVFEIQLETLKACLKPVLFATRQAVVSETPISRSPLFLARATSPRAPRRRYATREHTSQLQLVSAYFCPPGHGGDAGARCRRCARLLGARACFLDTSTYPAKRRRNFTPRMRPTGEDYGDHGSPRVISVVEAVRRGGGSRRRGPFVRGAAARGWL